MGVTWAQNPKGQKTLREIPNTVIKFQDGIHDPHPLDYSLNNTLSLSRDGTYGFLLVIQNGKGEGFCGFNFT